MRILFIVSMDTVDSIGHSKHQWRNVACWRPSAPTAPPLFGAPSPLKVEGKIEQIKLF